MNGCRESRDCSIPPKGNFYQRDPVLYEMIIVSALLYLFTGFSFLFISLHVLCKVLASPIDGSVMLFSLIFKSQFEWLNEHIQLHFVPRRVLQLRVFVVFLHKSSVIWKELFYSTL